MTLSVARVLALSGVFFGFLMVGPSAVRADGEPLGLQMVDVESSYPAGYHGKISVEMDERAGAISKFVFTDSRGPTLNYTPEDLHRGVVLVHAVGKDILKIAGEDYSAKDGGRMHLTFLRGFFGSDRREVVFDYVRRGGLMDWVLQTDDTEGRDPFTALAVVVGKTIGVPSSVEQISLKSADRMVRRYDPFKLPAGTLMLDGVENDLAVGFFPVLN